MTISVHCVASPTPRQARIKMKSDMRTGCKLQPHCMYDGDVDDGAYIRKSTKLRIIHSFDENCLPAKRCGLCASQTGAYRSVVRGSKSIVWMQTCKRMAHETSCITYSNSRKCNWIFLIFKRIRRNGEWNESENGFEFFFIFIFFSQSETAIRIYKTIKTSRNCVHLTRRRDEKKERRSVNQTDWAVSCECGAPFFLSSADEFHFSFCAFFCLIRSKLK